MKDEQYWIWQIGLDGEKFWGKVIGMPEHSTTTCLLPPVVTEKSRNVAVRFLWKPRGSTLPNLLGIHENGKFHQDTDLQLEGSTSGFTELANGELQVESIGKKKIVPVTAVQDSGNVLCVLDVYNGLNKNQCMLVTLKSPE